MSHTNLMLGSNWTGREMPEYVDVVRPGDRAGVRYVPERTCNAIEKEWGTPLTEVYTELNCSACGHRLAKIRQYQMRELPRYCPNCGARVEGD